MFKRSQDANQQNMFTGISTMLHGQAYDYYSDENAWHNVFRRQVLARIDEMLFKPLFDETMGAPNASTKILVGMMSLKEGFGWSDNELFEACRFNLLARAALGMCNMTDKVPVESTYYLLKKKVYEHQKKTGEDIIEKVFKQITKGQVIEFNVSGRRIRMDSKLIGSNIAWCTRYEIVHNALTLFYKGFKGKISIKLTSEIRTPLEEITKTESKKVVYNQNREEVQKRLQELGLLIYKLIKALDENDNENYGMLKRVFGEQFQINEAGNLEALPKEEIKSSSVQNPHDIESAYRDKDGQKVKGYSANVTETCDDEGLNLIVDPQLLPVNTPDVDFFQPAIVSSAEVLNHLPQKAHSDGAYQSPENVKFCIDGEIEYFFNGIQGKVGRYDLSVEKETLSVIDTQTGAKIPAQRAKSGKWSIKTEEGKSRYFTQKEVDTCNLRKQIENMPYKDRNRRNNVEATIFQLCYHTRNNKTRYRGLFKNKMWVTLRCLWINLKRIAKYICKEYGKTIEIGLNSAKKAAFFQKIGLFSYSKQILMTIPIFFNNVQFFLQYFQIKIMHFSE